MPVHQHVADHDRVASVDRADTLERFPVVRERKPRLAVERLAIPALVVELAGNGGVGGEETAGDDCGYHHAAGGVTPLAPGNRERDNGEHQDGVGGLRKNEHADERGGCVIGSASAQERAVFRARPFDRDLLVTPQKQRVERQREVEQLRREPHEVQRHDRREQEDEREGQRGARRAAARGHERVHDEQIQAEQQRVQHKEAAGAEHEHERRGDERVDVRLAVVEVRPHRIFLLRPTHEGEVLRPPDMDRLAALQEDPFRAAWVFLPHAHQIAVVEREVEIADQAVREAVVRGFVAFEPQRGLRQVDGGREGQQHHTEGQGDDRAGVPRNGVRCRLGHTGAPEVRKDRSARSTPRRRVARDTSWSSV